MIDRSSELAIDLRAMVLKLNEFTIMIPWLSVDRLFNTELAVMSQGESL